MSDLSEFVLARLDEDEKRFEAGELPYLDEAERRGRIRIMRANGDTGLLLTSEPVQTREERAPVPFPEKVDFLRREAEDLQDKDTLGVVAAVYDTHPDWREEWRP